MSQMARTEVSHRMMNRAWVIAWPVIVLVISVGNHAKCAVAQQANPADAAAAADQSAEKKPAEEQPAAAPAAEDAKQPAGNAAPKEDLGDARLIRLRLPLTGNADSHLKTTIERVAEQLRRLRAHEGRRPTLVLEFSPQGGPASFGEGTDFTRALSLANYLSGPELSGIKTVAYIPRTIKGHGVLVALACDQIVMNPEAELGEASIDEDASRAIDPKIVSAYAEIVKRRGTVPEAVVLGMVDKRLEILEVETDQGTKYVVGTQLDALKKDHTVISQETIVPAGSLGSFTGRKGREFGLLLASDTDALARGLGVSSAAMKQDESKLGDLRPVMLRIEGPITSRKVRQLETLIGTELRSRNVNWIGISIDSAGGELIDCLRLAETLAALDANDVQTVAYVPMEASGGAALVALACDQLVLQPEAHIGGKGTVLIDRQTIDAAHDPLDSLAKKVTHSPSLLASLIDADIEVFTYSNTKTGDVRYFSDEEAKTQPDAENWRRGARVKAAGEPLRLAANRAQELGVASRVVDNFDELKQLYGINGDIHVAEPNWALELIEALSSPALAVLLLVIGFVGIYVELHSPGMGVGAFVASLAFLLFFWSNFLNGTAEWLEVLLFLGGVFFLLLEVLVLPGFGIFGLGGGAMILASLVLATQTFVLPRTESQMVDLRHSLTIVAASTLLVIASSIALRRYLPNAPVFRKLLLNPPPEEELVDLDYRESLADFSHLVGEQGVATTNLMPAGKAEFNGQLVDVISEGLPIDRGSPIVVVKARGNRVLVRAANA
jgi:membrane-bound serine protease (ClpP class)